VVPIAERDRRGGYRLPRQLDGEACGIDHADAVGVRRGIIEAGDEGGELLAGGNLRPRHAGRTDPDGGDDGVVHLQHAGDVFGEQLGRVGGAGLCLGLHLAPDPGRERDGQQEGQHEGGDMERGERRTQRQGGRRCRRGCAWVGQNGVPSLPHARPSRAGRLHYRENDAKVEAAIVLYRYKLI